MSTTSEITSTTTTDLGHGWFANQHTHQDGSKSMTIRNPNKGQRIELSPPTLERLRAIFRAEG